MINSTSSVKYNTDSSSDSGTDSDDNEYDSAQILLPLNTVNQTQNGRKPGYFILKLELLSLKTRICCKQRDAFIGCCIGSSMVQIVWPQNMYILVIGDPK